MTFELRPYAMPFLVAAIISLLVAHLSFQRQNVKGGRALGILMLEFAVWGVVDFVRWSLAQAQAQILWLQIGHAVFALVPLTFLIFAAQLTDQDHRLTGLHLLLLVVEPVATILVIATNGLHSLYFAAFQSVPVAGFSAMAWRPGLWFWIHTAFSYAFILTATVILIRAALHGGPFVRVQLLTVLIAWLLPWGVNAYALSLPSSIRQVELTPLATAASGLIFAYALFRQRLLDIVPVARSILFEKLADGVLVLDNNSRIVDINLAAQHILHLDDSAYGRHILDLFPPWRDFFEALDGTVPEAHFELQGRLDPSRFYDVSLIFLRDRAGRANGLVVSLRDITERKHIELELHRMNSRLQRQVRKISALSDELQEQAIRDPLTGLYNRRYLDETLEREFSRARRGEYPISIIMLDVDQFKRVNDTHGHKAGDRVLQALSEVVRQHIRFGDIPCRFGGEEFVIVLPETPIVTAAQRAEQIRQGLHSSRFFKGDHAIVPTLSMGIAAYPSHGRSAAKVLLAADRAMYMAKSRGGNRAIRYDRRKEFVSK